jgi:hypothetical protein
VTLETGILFGLFSLLEEFLLWNIFSHFSVAQVAIAAKAYDLQKQQSPVSTTAPARSNFWLSASKFVSFEGIVYRVICKISANK